MRKAGAYVLEEGGAYSVRLHPDRRRQPVVRLNPAQFKKVVEGQTLLKRSDHSYILSESASHIPKCAGKTTHIPKCAGKTTQQSPFAYLFTHRDAAGMPFLTRLHFLALEQLRDDMDFGYAQTGLTINWQGFGGSRGARTMSQAEIPLYRLKARERAQKALSALGPQRAVFERICLEGTAMNVVERGLNLGRGNAKSHLKDALNRLVAFYRVG
jgi:hypothetical protein